MLLLLHSIGNICGLRAYYYLLETNELVICRLRMMNYYRGSRRFLSSKMMIRPRRVASSVAACSTYMVPCRSPPALPALPRQVHVQSCDGVPLPPRVLFRRGLAALDARGAEAAGGQEHGALLLLVLRGVGRERSGMRRGSAPRVRRGGRLGAETR